jgi:serine/threonine protein kinase
MRHGETTQPMPSGDGEGQMVGPYRLLRVIGEGGFGVVWLAERREPMVQRVALKIIKPGMDSRGVIARFEQERQALAVMDHPNVAKVFDGGVTDRGLPYFVMEHVQGEAITSFCDRQRYTIRQRLELFVHVCEAVQHAHHKGIIHRDIKPSNVLVTLKDGHAIPKVIDFGVAKAISHALTDKTIFTETGQMVGTPEYMSPEQATFGTLDVDTRTDVYSLGVLLYELLSGVLPFDGATLRSAGYAEIQRVIAEVEAPRPSTRLSGVDDRTGAAIASARQEDRERLTTSLKRELDWIPMKALRKDRTRRYASAEALAADLRRFMEGRAIEAAPESSWYLARKFIGRNRVAVGAGTIVAVAIACAGVAVSISLQHSREVVRKLQAEIDFRNEVTRLDDLIRLAQFNRQSEDAVAPAHEAFLGFTKLCGRADRRTHAAHAVYANSLFACGRVDEARIEYLRCLGARIEHLGPSDDWSIGMADEYAGFLSEIGARRADVDVAQHAAGTMARDHGAPGNATRDRVLWSTANHFFDSGRRAEALPFYQALVASIPHRDPPANANELPDARARLDACLTPP